MSLEIPIQPGRNELKERLRNGTCVFGTMINSFVSPEVVRILAGAGFDFVFIDTEHSPYDMETIKEMSIMSRLSGIFPICRISDAYYYLVVRPVDNCSGGVMVPRVETRAQCETAAKALKYPPEGIRGCAARDVLYGWRGKPPLPQYLEDVNEESFLVIQIESGKALGNLDDILSVKGIDVALVGPNDLSISLGVPGEHDHPKVVEAMDRVVECAAKHGIASGAHLLSTDLLKKWMDRGMTFITFSSDTGMLYKIAGNMYKELSGHIKG